MVCFYCCITASWAPCTLLGNGWWLCWLGIFRIIFPLAKVVCIRDQIRSFSHVPSHYVNHATRQAGRSAFLNC